MIRMMFGRVSAADVPELRDVKRQRERMNRIMGRREKLGGKIAGFRGETIRNPRNGTSGRSLAGLPEIGEKIFLVASGEVFQLRQAGGFAVGEVDGFPGVLCEINQQVAGGLTAFPRGDLVEWPVEEFPVSPANRPRGILVSAEILSPEEVLMWRGRLGGVNHPSDVLAVELHVLGKRGLGPLCEGGIPVTTGDELIPNFTLGKGAGPADDSGDP
tara:strand:+ start:499 stop:1143 length:645 start_codon:yes stop_codon:yes gene_type:complete